VEGRGKNDGTGCSTIICNQPGYVSDSIFYRQNFKRHISI
jgi:hypothetical protein